MRRAGSANRVAFVRQVSAGEGRPTARGDLAAQPGPQGERGGEREAGGRQQRAARGERRHQDPAEGEPRDLRHTGRYGEQRAAEQVVLGRQDLGEQPVPDPAPEGVGEPLGEQHREDGPQRQRGNGQQRGGERGEQREPGQGGARLQPVGGGEEHRRAQHLGERGPEHAERGEQGAAGALVDEDGEGEPADGRGADAQRGGEEERGELGGPGEGAVGPGHAGSLGRCPGTA